MSQKKFCPRDLTDSKNCSVGYTYPKAHTGKTNYVDYFYYLPGTGEKKRVKKFFDHIKKKSERKAEMENYILLTASLLRSGWRPFHSNTTDRSYKVFVEVLDLYVSGLKRYERGKTIHSYNSRVNILKEYINQESLDGMYCYEFDSRFCVEFLDWLTMKRNVTPRTSNNYKLWISSLSKWLIDRNYIRENPVENIKKLKEPSKLRQPLTTLQLQQMFDYLKKNDRHFLLACLFQYFTFIRPNELSYLKICDINVQNMTVFVSGTFSKNHKDGMVSLNPTLIKLMLEIGTFDAPMDHYIFGKDFKPSALHARADQFNKKWTAVRRFLKLPEYLKFYSLKDSGIRDLANAKGVVVARDQARHSDIATTNKYLAGKDLQAPAAAKDFKGAYTPD